MDEEKQLYLWKLDTKTHKLTCVEVTRRPNVLRTSKYIYYIVGKGQYRSRELKYLDEFRGNTVLSYSNDYTYIWDIISSALYRDYLRKLGTLEKAQEKYYKFRENNKRIGEN